MCDLDSAMAKRSTDTSDDVPGTTTVPERAVRHAQLDTTNYPPRGMSREKAARYVGVGITKFDEMVADRRMPKPKRIDGRVVWDLYRLDAAFSDLPEDDHINPFDQLLSKPNKDRG